MPERFTQAAGGAESVPHTLGDLVRRAARRWPDRIAFVDGDLETSFGELDRLTNRVANRLLSEDVQKGDRIAYLGKNMTEYFLLFWGAAKIGAVFVPVNWRLAPAEARYVVDDAEAVMVFATEAFADDVGSPALVRRTVVLRAGAGNPRDFESWLAGATADDPFVGVDPHDVVLQLYTSGTTGHPKGAMLTGDSLVHIRTAQPPGALWSSWSDEEVVLLSMPLFHIGGVGLALNGLVFGGRMFILQEFNAALFLRYIEEEGVTRLFIVPAALKQLLAEPGVRDVDFGRLRCISYGSSPIGLDLLRECLEVFGCGFVQNYGLTETCGTVVALGPEDHLAEGSPKMLSAGRALEGVELAIADASGNLLGPGETGEILLRSRANMAGYWKLPDVTRDTISAEGWLRTGDAGYVDAEGYLFIQDRIKDVVISGGENIYPAEIERALNEHPDIVESVVFGIPDEKWGEAVHAVLVWRGDGEPDAATLNLWLALRLARYKLPKSYTSRESLPRNATGKILRRDLRAPYWSGRSRKVG